MTLGRNKTGGFRPLYKFPVLFRSRVNIGCACLILTVSAATSSAHISVALKTIIDLSISLRKLFVQLYIIGNSDLQTTFSINNKNSSVSICSSSMSSTTCLKISDLSPFVKSIFCNSRRITTVTCTTDEENRIIL